MERDERERTWVANNDENEGSNEGYTQKGMFGYEHIHMEMGIYTLRHRRFNLQFRELLQSVNFYLHF